MLKQRMTRRGSALAAALIFFVVVTIAGTALITISGYHQVQTVRNGLDVRLMIAAEAGIESVRGRFTVIPVIQEDWSALLPNPAPAWNNVGNFTINGISVDVDARSVGGPSVPTARVRSTATSGNRWRTVEYTIKVASFSDYCVFNSGSGGSTLGTNYKAVGNTYFGGNVSIPNPGAQLWGSSYMVGFVSPAYGAGNNGTTGQPWNPPPTSTAHFPVEPPQQGQPAIPIPTWAAPWDALEAQAQSPTGHYWAENTIGIELIGTQYRRWYVRRKSVGVTPTGVDWLNLSSAISVAPNARFVNAAASITGGVAAPNEVYEIASQVYDIPNDSVIFVKTGSVTAVGPTVNGAAVTDALVGTNTWVQSTNWAANTTPAAITNGVGSDLDIVQNNGMPGQPYAKVLLLWGTLQGRRISIGCDHKVILADTIRYQALLDNPQWRAFHGDGVNGKQSMGALGFVEMLGVMSKQDCMLSPTWWRPIPAAQAATTQVGELIPTPHFPNASFPMDGVFFSVYDTRPHRFRNQYLGQEFWGHGGLIAGGDYAAGMGNHFDRRNYDWDYRLAETTPPYFLRAYNASATFINGSWRTYGS